MWQQTKYYPQKSTVCMCADSFDSLSAVLQSASAQMRIEILTITISYLRIRTYIYTTYIYRRKTPNVFPPTEPSSSAFFWFFAQTAQTAAPQRILIPSQVGLPKGAHRQNLAQRDNRGSHNPPSKNVALPRQLANRTDLPTTAIEPSRLRRRHHRRPPDELTPKISPNEKKHFYKP